MQCSHHRRVANDQKAGRTGVPHAEAHRAGSRGSAPKETEGERLTRAHTHTYTHRERERGARRIASAEVAGGGHVEAVRRDPEGDVREGSRFTGADANAATFEQRLAA